MIPLLQTIMLTHITAADTHSNMYIMDSSAKEHVSHEIEIFTDVCMGASVPLQTADGTCMQTHVSGTMRGLW